MEKQRWGDSPACPLCGDTDVYKMVDRKTGERNKRYLWRCHGCKQQYTVRKATVFEDSRIPLMHWCCAFWRACASKKGVSALQIKRETGLSYKSALFLMHRIRWAMTPPAGYGTEKLNGIVEIDEVYVGGKPQGKCKIGERRPSTKTPVVGMVERGGRVRAEPVSRVNAKELRRVIQENVCLSSRIMTDELPTYKGLRPKFEGGHDSVKHSVGEYVRGDVYTNTIEGYFSILQRALIGTHHSVSKHHLHRYVTETSFKYNTRKLDDGDRTILAIRGAEGKRLRYREQVQAK